MKVKENGRAGRGNSAKALGQEQLGMLEKRSLWLMI